MHLSTTLRHPAPAAAVAALLADPAFVAEVCAASGASSWEVDVDGDAGGAFTVTSTRRLSSDELPDAARRIVGPTITVREVDSWQAPAADGSRDGTLVLEVPGAPVSARAAMTLRAEGSRASSQSVEGELTASVPLIGGRLEKAAVGPLMAALGQLEALAGARLGA